MGEKSANLPINFQIYRVPGSPKKIETCFQDGSSMIFTSERAEVFEFLDACFKLL